MTIEQRTKKSISRRQFIQTGATAAAGVVLKYPPCRRSDANRGRGPTASHEHTGPTHCDNIPH